MVVHLSVSVQGTLAVLLISMDMYHAVHLDSMLSMVWTPRQVLRSMSHPLCASRPARAQLGRVLHTYAATWTAQLALWSPCVAPVMLSSLCLTEFTHTQVVSGGLEPQIH